MNSMVLNSEAITKKINTKKYFQFTRSFNPRISASRPLTSFSSWSTRFVISLLSGEDISNSPLKFPFITLRPLFDVLFIVQAFAKFIFWY
jgi:hypothetical protein